MKRTKAEYDEKEERKREVIHEHEKAKNIRSVVKTCYTRIAIREWSDAYELALSQIEV